MRLPASASALERALHPAGRGPNSSSLCPPLAAVVAVAFQISWEVFKEIHNNKK